jgi:hypothetical protein
MSYSAKAEYPVRCCLSIHHRRLWNTGSPAFADDDGGEWGACWDRQLRADGWRERAPDDRLREAIHVAREAGLLRRFAPRNDGNAGGSAQKERPPRGGLPSICSALGQQTNYPDHWNLTISVLVSVTLQTIEFAKA